MLRKSHCCVFSYDFVKIWISFLKDFFEKIIIRCYFFLSDVLGLWNIKHLYLSNLCKRVINNFSITFSLMDGTVFIPMLLICTPFWMPIIIDDDLWLELACKYDCKAEDLLYAVVFNLPLTTIIFRSKKQILLPPISI